MTYTNLLFDPSETSERLGDIVTLKDTFQVFNEPIEYLLKLMESKPTDCTFDRTAAEPPYFKTINYTTYGRALLVAPLQPDVASMQIQEAVLHQPHTDIDYVEFFANLVTSGQASKYSQHTPSGDKKTYEALVVLPGTNKLNSHVCINKIRHILLEHGTQAIFKPHPLTTDEDLAKFKESIGGLASLVRFAYKNDDVYDLMQRSELVYTTHFSESALYAVCLGKTISPITTFQSRMFHGFSHINEFLFNHANDTPELVTRMFDCEFSGLFVPEIQPDWKLRIQSYLEWIHCKRASMRYHYI